MKSQEVTIVYILPLPFAIEGKGYIVGEYSIAEMGCYPWIVPYLNQQQDITEFPHLEA